MITLFLPSACDVDRLDCGRMLFGVVGNPDDSTATGLVLSDTGSFSFSKQMTYYFIKQNKCCTK